MTILACSLDCLAGGFSKVTVCWECSRTGSNTDNFQFRIKRTGNSQTVYLPGEPNFIMTADKDIRSYTWIDPSIPADGDYIYTLQVRRNDGGGTFYGLSIVAEHFKR